MFVYVVNVCVCVCDLSLCCMHVGRFVVFMPYQESVIMCLAQLRDCLYTLSLCTSPSVSLSVVAVTFDGETSFARYQFDATMGQFGSEGRLRVRTRDLDALLVHVGWQPIGSPDTNDFLSVDIVNRTAVLAADLGRGMYVHGIVCLSYCSWSL